jgi:hypothetical protein
VSNRFGAPLTACNFGHNEGILTPGPIQLLHTSADLAVGMPLQTVNGVKAPVP